MPLTCTSPHVVDLDVENARVLISSPHGLLVAECFEREFTQASYQLPRPHPLELVPGVALREHVIVLSSGDGERRWRGELLACFDRELPALRDPCYPAGLRLIFSPHNVLGDTPELPELTSLLAPVHQLAAELLVDPLSLHAERLHYAHRRLRRYRDAEADTTSRTFTFVAPRTLLDAELALLHLSATLPDEHEVRAMSLALAETWTGSAPELLAATRRLLA